MALPGRRSNQSFGFTVDTRQLAALEKRLRALGPKGEKEFGRAMIGTRRAITTEAKRTIAGYYNLKQARIADDLKSGDNKTRFGPGFYLLGRKYPITFVSYGARALKRGGVRVSVKRGKQSTLPGGFPGRAPAGNTLFWIRTGEPKREMRRGHYVGQVREPIKPLFGPSIADGLNNRDVRARIDTAFRVRLSNELRRRLTRLYRTGASSE